MSDVSLPARVARSAGRQGPGLGPHLGALHQGSLAHHGLLEWHVEAAGSFEDALNGECQGPIHVGVEFRHDRAEALTNSAFPTAKSAVDKLVNQLTFLTEEIA